MAAAGVDALMVTGAKDEPAAKTSALSAVQIDEAATAASSGFPT